MNRWISLGYFMFVLSRIVTAQNYQSFLTGNPNDSLVQPLGGICLMGGASEDDNAMKWFLQRANGGDVLVLRTSGGDGYNTYLYSTLGISVNSVETIVCLNPNSSSDPYILDKIDRAEAIWFAGGDQWNYISYWRNTPFNQALNDAIHQRKAVVGGISAGMAIQGQYYFSAQNGTVTSAAALSNPFGNSVTVDGAPFVDHNFLNHTITDTHFDNPDRKGRLVVFLARMFAQEGVQSRAIACDEYTAVCIDTMGEARVFGDFPNYEDYAYFLQVNCALGDPSPELCAANTPLTWNRNGEAVKTYKIPGQSLGQNTFNLTDWKTGVGGQWEQWSVNLGVLSVEPSAPVECGMNALNEEPWQPNIYLNAETNTLFMDIKPEALVEIFNALGQEIWRGPAQPILQLSGFSPGLYQVRVQQGTKRYIKTIGIY